MNGNLLIMSAFMMIKDTVRLTSQRLPGCCGLPRSGTSVSKVTEFGRSFCMLVLDMIRNGTIAKCIFHTLGSRMTLNCIRGVLSV